MSAPAASAPTAVKTPTMQCVEIKAAHGTFDLTSRPIPQPKDGQVLIQVASSGVCGGEHVIHHNLMPMCSYPR